MYDIEVVIYEPTLKTNTFNDYRVIEDFNEFASITDVVLANRMDEELSCISDKVYTRDLYSRD